MELLHVEGLKFKYNDDSKYILDDISFSVKEGELITICGESGCGKTTLARLLKKEVRPAGEMSGNIYINEGIEVGYVMQNVECQAVTEKVYSELAFGLENKGLDNDVIVQKIAEISSYFGIEDLYMKKISELSGGQKQLVNLAAVLIMKPEILILDEPTSQLDKLAADEFIGHIGKINRDFGMTVIVIEHRLDEIFQFSDRILVLQNGRLLVDSIPERVYRDLYRIDESHKMLMAMPAVNQLVCAIDKNILENDESIPDGISAARRLLRKELIAYGNQEINNGKLKHDNNEVETNEIETNEIESVSGIKYNTKSNAETYIRNISFRYSKSDRDVLIDLCLSVEKNTIHSIIGGNGTGKSTVLKIIAGILKPYKGKVKTSPAIIMPQSPHLLFCKETLGDELENAEYRYNKTCDEIKEILVKYDIYDKLESLKGRHPYDLSGGEIQLAALALTLINGCKYVLLDEPTKGLDAFYKSKLAEIFGKMKKEGYTILMVTHDLEFAAKVSDVCSMIFNGEIINTSGPVEFFKNNVYYTTVTSKLFREYNENCITIEHGLGYIKEIIGDE